MPEQQTTALAELRAMLLAVTGEDETWARALTADSRLEADLRLDSLELAALGELLRDRYGPGVSLPGYLAALDMDQLIGLTLGDVLGYLATPAGPGPAATASGGTASGGTAPAGTTPAPGGAG